MDLSKHILEETIMKKYIIIYPLILLIISGSLYSQSALLNEDAVSNAQISNYEAINSPHLDFSPVFFGEGLVFIGNQEKGAVYDPEINEDFFELKYLPLNSEMASIENFSSVLNIDEVHKGPCGFSQQDRVIYYTKEKRFKDDRDAVLQILKAYQDEGEWVQDGEFPFNSDDFSNMHPAVSPDGSYMIFSSNREGSLGGYDLYISRYENGYWKQPENLGSAINSYGNESFPYIHENGTLVYSSDGRGGHGGLDLFVSGKEENGLWIIAENMGKPFNSKADDFGITVNADGVSGFFTTNRKGGQGKDDIYEFSTKDDIFSGTVKMEAPLEENFQFSTTMLNKDTKSPVKNAEVYAIPLVGDGSELILSHFEIKSIDVVSEEDELVMHLRPKTGELAQYLKLTDENGRASFLLDRNKRYFIYSEGKGYKSTQTAIDAQDIVPEITLLMVPDQPKRTTPAPRVINTSPIPSSSTTSSVNIEQALNRRELVVFNEIYYEYNSINLKTGATRELDLLANYLLNNPLIRVELSSHTDARGQRAYNQKLSNDRAQEAKRYLINKGVSDFRVIAIGKGENEIRNHCANGVTCTDAEHEYNRRTEVEILD